MEKKTNKSFLFFIKNDKINLGGIMNNDQIYKIVYRSKYNLHISVSSLLNGSYKLDDLRILYMNDNNDDIKINQLLQLIKRNVNPNGLVLKLNNISRYGDLINYLSINKDEDMPVYIDLSDMNLSINDVCDLTSPFALIVNPGINEKNITSVLEENRKKLSGFNFTNEERKKYYIE